MSGYEPPILNYDVKYQWCTKGANCAFCNIMAGRVYELDVYITSTVYPGFHPNCNCYLKMVDASTPTSDLDIFGSSLNLRNNSWLEMLFGNFINLWQPYNTNLTNQILSFSEPGITASEAMRRMRASQKNRFGMFKDNKGIFSSFESFGSGWNVWQSSTADVYQTFGDILTSITGLPATPAPLRPVSPLQSYHNTIWNLGR